MLIPSRIAWMIASAAALLSAPALAQSVHPHHHRAHRYAAAQPNGGGEPHGYRNAPYPQFFGGYYGSGRGYGGGYGGNWEAAANARLTAQAYRDPGVTLELAPDAKETATGGPVGGVPGFSGH